jgi:hypothetical protein
MKKFIYISLIAITTALTTISCTEEDVAPIEQTNNGGGAINVGKI